MDSIDYTELHKLQKGQTAQISGYKEKTDINQRLNELGLVVGTKVMIKRFAPLGDPIELEVRGYNLSIRKKEAAQIMIKKIAAKHSNST